MATARPAEDSGGGILEADDFNWDSSYVGTYDSAVLDPLDPFFAYAVTISMSKGLLRVGSCWGRSKNGMRVAVQRCCQRLIVSPSSFRCKGTVHVMTVLLPWFPTAEERSLILQYCANAAELMMAIPSELNPMLAINLPLALDSRRGTSRTAVRPVDPADFAIPGMNSSADALRVSLLGIGAVHQADLLARSGVSTLQPTAIFQYASNLRDTKKELVRRAVLDGGGGLSDAALGAVTSLATIDIFFRGDDWRNNFDLAKGMVAL